FQSNMYGPGYPGNNVVWNIIIREIDAGRPLNWSVLYYGPNNDINHSLTGVGYKLVGTTHYVYVNTTWYENEEWWTEWTSGSYDYGYPLIPGGSIDCDLRLRYPDTKALMFRGLKYMLKWESSGSQPPTSVDLYRHTGYNNNYWTELASGLPSSGSWLYTAPNDSLSARFALKGYYGGNLYAADGESLAYHVRTYEHSNELVLVGHYDTDGSLKDLVFVNDTLFTADMDGLVNFDVTDSSLPVLLGSLPLPDVVALDYQGAKKTVYLASEADTVFSVDVTDPQNPSRKGAWSAPDHCYDAKIYKGDYLIVACRSKGVYVLDVKDPSNPTTYSSFDTPGTAYGLDIQGDLLFTADGTKGLRIIDLSDLQNLKEIGSYDPTGIAKAVCVRGTLAFLLGGGTLAIRIIDISDPQNPHEIQMIDTPGTPTWAKMVSVTHLMVGDGESGLRVYDVSDPTNPQEVGYLNSHGHAASMAFDGDLIYLADGGDGLYVIHSDLIGVGEERPERMVKISIPTIVSGDLILTGLAPVKTQLKLSVRDVLGRLVRSFSFEVGGSFRVNYPANLTSGVYFVQVLAGKRLVRAKTIVVR
ncbi:MAG TPA: hypothetical protein EYP24_03855, partial [bacterium (Candidatus Stahlbacteria)]|nr:hypothetical protein [Candidatus Stahlbacteria bacterium]